jgi:ABC-type proline/glycine betaine transport system permease subunit
VGLIFPIALIFVALQALTVVIAIVESSRVKRTRLQVYFIWRRYLIVAIVLALFPALISIGETVSIWSVGHYSARPLILLLVTALTPIGVGLYVVKKRRGTHKDQNT